MRGSASRSVSPSTPIRRIEAGIRSISSGVRLRLSGSSAGSPFGGASASGLTFAARCPWVRNAFSSEVAACTACRSSRSGSAPTTAPAGAGTAPATGSGGAEAEAGCALVTIRSGTPRSWATVS